ncbi:hypothetical protein Tco_1012291, partial [Tanacetum coccineum]
YIDGIPDIGVPESQHEGRFEGKRTIGRNNVTPNYDDLEHVRFTILQNMTSIAPYIHEHMPLLKRNNSRQGLHWLETEHKRTFSNWLRDTVKSRYPNVERNEKSTVQNSGVTLVATTTDNSRLSVAKESYYGVIEEIWELDYNTFFVPLFKCKWVDNIRGVKVDKDGFTCVNLSTDSYSSDPFILAKQATQIFYVEDPSDTRWKIVIENVVDEDE